MEIMNRKLFYLAPALALHVFIGVLSPASQAGDINTAKIAEIPKRMQAFVDDNTIAGSVTLVTHHGQVVSLEAVGWADLKNQKPMRPDHLFWIASMTKPITATAVLILQDQGKLSVEDPVEKYLPEFKGQWMIQEKSDTAVRLVRPPRPITLRDLLTHTSGLGDVSAPRSGCSLAELAMTYSQQPLHFPPGSKWEYSNAGINTLGRIVEVVSGQPYAEFLHARILQPLRMKDTTFWPTPAQARRIAKTYKPGSNGRGLEETDIYFLKGPLTDRQRTPFPAGGLFSTAQDMARFYQMMLNGGTYHGQRLLTQKAVTELTRTQTGEIKTGFVDGMSFGFGFAVVKEPQGVTAMFSPGTFGHGGAYTTQSWADPQNDLILILMIQRAGFPNGDNSPVRKAFQEAAVAAFTP
jgi:CubicO group peptidase (beta-lactamase class C family)